jgi:hypothetical protein
MKITTIAKDSQEYKSSKLKSFTISEYFLLELYHALNLAVSSDYLFLQGVF